MTLVPTSVASAELVSLAEQINKGHRLVVGSHRTTLVLAIEVGHWLLEALKLVPDGEWPRWMEDNCDFSKTTVGVYQRLAHYEHELGDQSSIREALNALIGLPNVRPAGVRPDAHPPELKAKARAMLEEGQSAVRVGEQLGIGDGTVRTWRKTDQEIAAAGRRNNRRQRAARKALKEKEEREALAAKVAKAGPSEAELYSRLRLTLEAVDPVILDHTDNQNTARLYREARSFMYKAERRIVKALGVE